MPSAILCGPDSCGGRACAIKKIERSEDSAAQGLVRRGDPSLGKWPDPSDHENHESFIVSQIDAIAEDTAKKERYTPKLVEHGPNDGPSANWTTFKDNVEAIGLEGLFGCTSIVLVSRKGAWISHIWQTTMDPEEEDLDEDDSTMDPFEHLIEVELPNRIPPDMEFYKFYEYGLNDMKDHPEDGDAGVMFGNSKDGATDTPTSLNMKAFIVTPRKWTYPEVYFDARGRRIPHQVLAHVDFRKGTVRYPDQVRALQTAVTEVYGDIPVEVIDYNPTIVRPENWAAFQWTGKLIVNGELMPIPEYHGRLSRRNVRGKILLQYQPAATCQDEAEWRLWVEGQPAGDRADKWPPLPGQIFSSSSEPDKSDPSDEKDPSDKKVERRQVCELPNKSMNPISATPTSVGVSASPPVSQGGSSKRAGIEVTLSRNGSMASQTLTSPDEHRVEEHYVLLFSLLLLFANHHIGHHKNLINFNLLHTRTVRTQFHSTVNSHNRQILADADYTHHRDTDDNFKAGYDIIERHPRPPSEAVAIFYTETLAPDDDDGKKFLREGAWYMFPVMAADAANFDPCNKYPMGHLQLHEPLNLNSVPWPPPIDGEKPFFNRRKCKYKGGNGSRGFGKMSCDDVPEFDCESDPRAKKLLECESHPKAEQSFKPRILCKFPVLEPAGRTQNMKDAVGQP
ncbi:immunoglobulin a1 protease [Colletotrichum higginsianum]|nr:immunoglobulin a1 protease [Colletotrichum higginsianum]